MNLAARARFLYRAHKARWRDQRVVLDRLTRAIRPGDVAVDVGAHKGAFLYWMARAARPGRVLAFEPQAELAEYLRAACACLGLDHVAVRAAAASERSGTALLSIPGDGSAPGASLEPALARRERVRAREVETVALDDALAGVDGRVAAVKIDVEGHELAVLRGAERILREHAPLLVVEIEQRHLTGCGVRDVLDELARRGYGGHFVRHGRLVPIAEFDAARHQRAEGERFWDARDYCNDFVLSKAR